MANKNLLKKIAPVILSATVAMTGMPSAAFAAEFSAAPPSPAPDPSYHS